jgi:hypothetical protein
MIGSRCRKRGAANQRLLLEAGRGNSICSKTYYVSRRCRSTCFQVRLR